MRTTLLLIVFSILALAAPGHAQLKSSQAADLVLGQANFTTNGASNSASGLTFPRSVAIHPITGQVFVADNLNNRVLRYRAGASLTNGASAEGVLGQADFGLSGAALTQSGMNRPYGIFVDRLDRLWVCDFAHHRVLRFENASTKPSGAPADGVLGQATFLTATSSNAANGLNNPSALLVTEGDILWVADRGNHRVLRFDNVSLKLNGAAADGVLGQAGFGLGTNALSPSRFDAPAGLAITPGGTLFVADSSNHRVLRFDNAASKSNGAAADRVLGQADLSTGAAGLSEKKFNLPLGLALNPRGDLFVADFLNQRVVGFFAVESLPTDAPADIVLGKAGFTGDTLANPAAALTQSQGVACDALGRLYVSQSDSNRVQRFSPDGKPRIRIKGKKTSTDPTFTLRGTATSDLGVDRVEFKAGRGGFRRASGTSKWKAPLRKLTPGATVVTVVTVVTVRAFGLDGSKTQIRARVKRV